MKVKVLKPVFAETASQLVNTASRFPETILLKKDHWVVDAKSLLGVLALSLQPGQTLEVIVENEESTDVTASFLALGLFEEA
ncbi:HPr family phosphocarrier protein [Pseudalkalibacillus hwajinpoensis]|uniref:HPr family phosphocarrier protein n=1 Tax=Guptibacillus hwajinpoensis TaxID=208199 RepID=UPI00325B3D65